MRLRTISRAILAFSAAISFVLLLGVLCLWVRSHFIADGIYFKPVAAPEEFASPMPFKPGRWHYQWHLAALRGKVQLERRNLAIGEETPPGTIHLPANQAALSSLQRQDPLDVDWRFAGMEYFRRDREYLNQPPVRFWHWGFLVVTVPYWLLALASGVLPTVVAVRWVKSAGRRRRKREGKCTNCGYDLRGGGGICPECGTNVETTVVAVRQ